MVPPMGCSGNNATPPGPATAPGLDSGDLATIVNRVVARQGGVVDSRMPDLVPGFDAPFFQAGLAGYSDPAMRLIARQLGCPFCVTEALLDRTLLAGGRGFAKADLGDIAENVPGGDDDHPLAGQIMGSDPSEMAAAAIKMIEQGTRRDREYRAMVGAGSDGATKRRSDEEQAAVEFVPEGRGFATIDVNLACPVKKIARKARGGHWLAEPEGAIRILEAVREAVPAETPTTVKMRRSFDDTNAMRDAFYRIFDAAYDMGYAWVTVHGRTVEQKYVGPSRWDLLREIAQRKHPGRARERLVFGSGDVWTVGDIFRMLDYTGMHAASVARGCIGNPWVFRQARQLLAGEVPTAPTLEEQRRVLEAHFTLALAVNQRMRHPEQHTARVMRKFAIRFAAHHPEGEAVRRRMIEVAGIHDWTQVLDTWYAPTGAPTQ